MNLVFALGYTSRNLARGGQRTLLAMACVAFGVMSLVALQLLSSMIAASVGIDARLRVGGDASISRGGRPMTPDDVETLERMRAEGALATYELTTGGSISLLKRDGGGRVHFLTRSLGVDPSTFPILGDMRLAGENSPAFGALITQPGDAVITRDIAEAMGLSVGDGFTVGGGPAGAPFRLRVSGIADLTPDRQGDTVYYSLETARRMTGRDDVAMEARVLWGPVPPSVTVLVAEEWSVSTHEDVAKQRANVVDLFGTMLKGAGILGLLLGGIGVSNTMQVLLARRNTEIATLKTLGYERHHLVLLFGLETAILGTLGAIVGVVAGVGLSAWLRVLLARTGPIMLEQAASPTVLAGGIAVGMATAVIFGLQPIARASAVRPSILLRDLPARAAWGETIGLYAALGMLFAALASAVLGSVVYGAGVVLTGVVGLALLAAVLGAGLLAAVAIPLPLPGIIELARNNLRRQPLRAVVALVALFCGVFAIGFAGATISNARARLASRALASDGYNIAVYCGMTGTNLVATALDREGVRDVERFVTAPVEARDASGRSIDGIRTVTGCGGDRTGTVKVVEGEWVKADGSALAPARLRRAPWGLVEGDLVEVSAPGGDRAKLSITGFYDLETVSPLVPRPAGMIVDEATAVKLGGSAASVSFAGMVDANRLDEVSEALDAGVPDAMVLSRADLNSAMQGVFESLFAFVVGVAGLALVAGGVLIANSVGLAMLERRREVGILKAIGYSSARVLAGIAVEYSLLGLVAGVTGMGAVAIAFSIINRWQPSARLALDPVQAPVMIAIATAIALASAVAVAWRPARSRPLDVLRAE